MVATSNLNDEKTQAKTTITFKEAVKKKETHFMPFTFS